MAITSSFATRGIAVACFRSFVRAPRLKQRTGRSLNGVHGPLMYSTWELQEVTTLSACSKDARVGDKFHNSLDLNSDG